MRTCKVCAFLILVAPVALASAGTWTEQVSNSNGQLYVVHAVSRDIAWAAGDNAQVVRTTDGGEHWEAHRTPSGSHSALFAFDAETCVVTGYPGRFWRTTNGGTPGIRFIMSIPPSTGSTSSTPSMAGRSATRSGTGGSSWRLSMAERAGVLRRLLRSQAVSSVSRARSVGWGPSAPSGPTTSWSGEPRTAAPTGPRCPRMSSRWRGSC